MSWQDDFERRRAAFPTAIRKAHAFSSRHRAKVTSSNLCGCFYCCSMFSPDRIEEWVDDDDAGVGQTAMCPKCGIDSVLPDNVGLELTPDFLREMHRHWF